MACPSAKDCRWAVQNNLIKNCPTSVDDIEAAVETWGKNIDMLKGKTTRHKSIHVAADFVKAPKEIVKLHKEVFLTADTFFVNKTPFFLMLSRKT